MTYLAIACRCVLALVFCVSAASKLRNRGAFLDFEASIKDLRLLPDVAARPAAVAVVAGELATVALIAVPVTATVGLLLSAALLITFSGAIAMALGRGSTAGCRCFGPVRAQLGWSHVIRNVVLSALAITGALASSTPAHPAGIAVALVTAGLVAAVAITMDDIINLFTPQARG